MSIYLEHHGILGQKWGKRNGPPYPLDESDKSAREKSLINRAYKVWEKSGKDNPKNKELSINNSDSRITKVVKDDYNTMSEKEFRSKYHCSKSDYRRRVKASKTGDPIKNPGIFTMAWFMQKQMKMSSDQYVKYVEKNSRDIINEYNNRHLSELSNKINFNDRMGDFLLQYTPRSESPNSLYDIDDFDLIRMHIDDRNFRNEYGVSDSDYALFKKLDLYND